MTPIHEKKLFFAVIFGDFFCNFNVRSLDHAAVLQIERRKKYFIGESELFCQFFTIQLKNYIGGLA